ncbi:acetyl-CoA acetyltransferase, cytosolic-like [Topomyia yanbarensis]|uniref:acetyl-CoA acetyltransferase, cytosolic-like n=1 Tax=Topomyia yanbarensis TaxID=2498891 RepID=UPI00273B79F9|nr:acetyl-CoA acetyltransferase, cytosolic-like [Topomyia yanbarensis]XP_058822593.1 acetyl-CoA acetyltransferase, cytosolic-like [Topomyia yanbarensis]XP_058822594.1 acetyl-CoA acetyltransferase, cytosolic-like [Topomyia yanbarensis]XP_058822596.1 acetyl-CoA acetyltransferase, cytosolic-like [Topomyia yanbarensis]XP_058822597.1 acetyl-CoA acetyltransferase, cytosolic-like [Topomyia yanbarensis]
MTSPGEVYIVSAARTPIGNFQGTVSSLTAAELGAVVVKEVLNRASVPPADVDEVILGQALTAAQGQNPARQAAIKAGLPKEVPAYLVNMLCGSGLKTVSLGYQAIRSGDSSVVVAGGQESMSKAPHAMHLRSGTKMGEAKMIDTMLHDGLTDAFHDIHMGITAENVAKESNITREQQDALALESQKRAEEAQNKGYFTEEIVAVQVPTRNGTISFEKDEFPKPGTTLEKLAKLKPCFIKDGTVTAGNASGLNDSAAAVLLMSAEEVQKRDTKPMARIVAVAQTGICPKTMGIAPVSAVSKVLQNAGWKVEDVDLFELNEAFAAQSVAVVNGLGVSPDKVNINGGAIALGHPVGASGCRVLVTLLYALKRTNGKKGVASLCIGGGMGVAMAVEMV